MGLDSFKRANVESRAEAPAAEGAAQGELSPGRPAPNCQQQRHPGRVLLVEGQLLVALV